MNPFSNNYLNLFP